MLNVDTLNLPEIDDSILEELKQMGENMTPQDIREQKISFILGTLSHKSSITREFVENELNRMYGVVNS